VDDRLQALSADLAEIKLMLRLNPGVGAMDLTKEPSSAEHKTDLSWHVSKVRHQRHDCAMRHNVAAQLTV
jgi:invasion protein IalB